MEVLEQIRTGQKTMGEINMPVYDTVPATPPQQVHPGKCLKPENTSKSTVFLGSCFTPLCYGPGTSVSEMNFQFNLQDMLDDTNVLKEEQLQVAQSEEKERGQEH